MESIRWPRSRSGAASAAARPTRFDDIAIVPQPAHPRPRGGLDRLADRRLPLRAARCWPPRWTRVVSPETAIADRPARRSRRAQPRRPVDPLRRPGSRCSTRSPGCRRGRRTPPDAGDLRRADPRGPDRGADRRGPRRPGSPSPRPCRRSAPQQFWKTVVDAGRRPVRHPRHHGLGRARLAARPSRSTSSSSSTSSTCPVIVGGCATYTAALHLMRTGAAGVLVGFGGGAAHTTATCSASRCRWPPPSPTWPRPGATTWTSPAAATCT